MVEEVVTIASESKRLERLNTELVDANKASDAAVKAATANARSQPDNMVALLEHAAAVKLADQVSVKTQSTISAVKATIGRLEWEQKAKPLMDARDALRVGVLAAYKQVAATFKQFGVEATNVKIDGTTETPIAAVNISGDAIPKPPSTIKRSGGGGSRGTKVFQTDNGDMGSRDFLAYAQSHSKKSERIEKMLADPDGGRKGLTHLAVEVANELSVTIK